jgi:hypothetical protein
MSDMIDYDNSGDSSKDDLIAEVKKIHNGLSDPMPDDVKNVVNKSTETILREDVLKTVQLSLNVVAKLDEKIEAVLDIIFQKIQTDNTVKIEDLFRLFNILKGYRLNSFRTVTDPLKSSITSNMDSNADSGSLDKVSSTLPSSDLKKLKNLSSNIEKFNKIIELIGEGKTEN